MIKVNNTIVFLSRAGGGKSPMKPGNRLNNNVRHGAKSCSKMLKDEKMLVCDANLFFLKRFLCFRGKEDKIV